MSYPIFIIGCPRSGTTILGEFFENSKKCNYYNEIDLWKDHTSISKYDDSEIFNKLISLSRKHKKLSIFLKGLRIFYRDLSQQIGIIDKDFDNKLGHRLTEKDVTLKISKKSQSFLSDKHLVVKTTPNSLRIPFLRKIFPDAKFIHIIRDGRDVTCSLMNSPSGILWSYIKPPGWKKIKKKFKGLQRCAWQWKATMDIINSDKIPIPAEDFIEINYAKLQSIESTKIGFSAVIRIASLLTLLVILGDIYGMVGLSYAVLISVILQTIFLSILLKKLKL